MLYNKLTCLHNSSLFTLCCCSQYSDILGVFLQFLLCDGRGEGKLLGSFHSTVSDAMYNIDSEVMPFNWELLAAVSLSASHLASLLVGFQLC